MNLSVDTTSSDNSRNVVQKTSDAYNPAQRFKLVKQDDGCYQLLTEYSNYNNAVDEKFLLI